MTLAQNAGLNIIPQPKSVVRQKGEFKLNYKTKIAAFDKESQESAAVLNDYLLKNYGYKLEFVNNPGKIPKNAIVFERLVAEGNIPSEEDYALTISAKEIRIKSSLIRTTARFC